MATLTDYLVLADRFELDPGDSHRIKFSDLGADYVEGTHLHSSGNTHFRQWITWMDRIPPGFLQQGQNSITIARRSAGFGSEFFPECFTSGSISKNFFSVANVAIYWREPG